MRTLSKRLLSTVLGTVLTGVYWITFFYVAYGLTAGDPAPGQDGASIWMTVLVYAGGFLLYGVFAWVWRSVDLAVDRRGR